MNEPQHDRSDQIEDDERPEDGLRSRRTDMSRSEIRSLAYSQKTYSMGPIDVKNVETKSSHQNSSVSEPTRGPGSRRARARSGTG